MNFADQDNALNLWKCVNCNWCGCASELETDRVETCFGPDEIEVCPVCGCCDLILSKEGFSASKPDLF